MALGIVVVYLRTRYRRSVAISSMVPGLVNTVLDRLATQRAIGLEGIDDGFLFQPHLRDDVLREVHSLKDREQIWAKVRDYVEQNANVRIVQRESIHGEIGRAWEWIGPVEGLGAHRRPSKKLSYSGPDLQLEPVCRDASSADGLQRPYY